MTLKTTSSACTFAASQSAGTVVKSTITLSKLKELIASPHSARVMALTEGSGVASPAALKVTSVYIQSVDDRKKLVLVYKGDACQIDAAMGAWARNVINKKPFERFAPEHGLEIEYTYENGGTAYNSVTAWDLQNQDVEDIAAKLILASNNPRYRPPGGDGTTGDAAINDAIQTIVEAIG